MVIKRRFQLLLDEDHKQSSHIQSNNKMQEIKSSYPLKYRLLN